MPGLKIQAKARLEFMDADGPVVGKVEPNSFLA